MRVTGDRPSTTAAEDPQVRNARNAVYAVFFGAGFIFASWASRIPQVRAELGVGPGVLGLVLLSAAVGSAFGTSLSGLLIGWMGEIRTVSTMAWAAVAGMLVVAAGCQLGPGGIPEVAGGLFLFGIGNGAWDVAMNVQGAAVERELHRAILPRFHAGWSIGTVAGAGVGAVMVALHVPVPVHLIAAALLIAVAVPAAARRFLPSARTADHRDPGQPDPGSPRRRALAAWTDPRTLLIGLFVLCMAFTEGSGNDWLSLGVIDGYHTAAAVGTLTFALFLAAMTAGRWFGPRLIDRYGRVRVLRACSATALTGLLMIVFGGVLPVALAGAVLMGLGTSLGFPVGLSAAADDPRHAAPRVSTAASIGYLAFLAGPPAIGFLADQVGVLRSLAVTGVLIATAFVLARFTRPLPPAAGRPYTVNPIARSCARPLPVMSAGRQGGSHSQSTRKPETSLTPASSARIWSSMMLVSGQAAEVSVIVITAVRSCISTRRTNPRSTMLTPRSGSITSSRASRTAAARASGAIPASPGGSGMAAAAAGAAGAAGGGAEPAWLACSPAGRSVSSTRQVGLAIQSAVPCALRRTRTMSSPASTFPSTRMSRAGLSPACSARAMTRSSSRATGSQVRPGPNRSRAWARTASRPITAPRAARPSGSARRTCSSPARSSAASDWPASVPGSLTGRRPPRSCRPHRPCSRRR